MTIPYMGYDIATEYARSAISYQYSADNCRKYGEGHYKLAPYAPVETSLWRAWTCWSAATKRGLVLG